MSQTLAVLTDDVLAFPNIEHAFTDPNGLLAIGGDLSPQRLIAAYQQGIFPWFNEGEPPLWWSPNPRAIFYTDQIRINRTLAKFIRNCDYQVTLNKHFSAVIEKCAHAPFRREATWINNKMINAYCRLHQLGFAHSVEVWQSQKLIGGLYGVGIGGYFSGESMFYEKSNASKIALVALSVYFKNNQISIIDAQMQNPFLQDMGAVEISREKFVILKDMALKQSVDKLLWSPKSLTLM